MGDNTKSDNWKVTIELTMEHKQMYDEMIEDILSSDTFSTDCIGGWAEGVHWVKGDEHRWMLLEETEADSSLLPKARQAFDDGQELPHGYHYFNRDTAEKVIAFGLLQHGIGFLDGTTDANDLDVAIQNVVLGEQKYC